jgi:hypothetical protein
VNRSIDTATSRQLRIRRVHNRVHALLRDVPLDQLQSAIAEENQH